MPVRKQTVYIACGNKTCTRIDLIELKVNAGSNNRAQASAYQELVFLIAFLLPVLRIHLESITPSEMKPIPYIRAQAKEKNDHVND